MPEIIFPVSTGPSQNPAETGGRLINAYAEKAPEGSRGKYIWRRAPGLDEAFQVGGEAFRGALLVGSILYVAAGDTVYSVTKSGSLYNTTALSGTLGGVGQVTMAHNMRSTKQIMIQTSAGPYQIIGSAVSSFSDPDLPSSLMVTYQDGYFFWPTAAGQVTASDLNDDEINGNSFTTAEGAPDGLIRLVPFNRDMLFFGEYSLEPWTNDGSSPFPYRRVTVRPFGLFGINAVTGYEPGFPGPLVFIANNGAVYRMSGYDPERISTPFLDRLIEAQTDRSALMMSSFVAAGHPYSVLSSPDWTWVFDHSTGFWHERASYEMARWRVGFTINAFNEWLAFDQTTNQVYRVNDRNPREGLEPLVADIWSIQHHSFPLPTRVNRASFDFITGVGLDRGIDPIQTDPKISVSWSDDGGRKFGNSLLRKLGTQGERRTIDIFNVGRTKREGRVYRLQCADPVEFSFIGGSHFGG